MGGGLDGGGPLQSGVPQKNLEISGSETCIVGDPGVGFAMDIAKLAKKNLRTDRGVQNPPTLPLDLPLYHLLPS